jgi:hypothetical protein
MGVTLEKVAGGCLGGKAEDDVTWADPRGLVEASVLSVAADGKLEGTEEDAKGCWGSVVLELSKRVATRSVFSGPKIRRTRGLRSTGKTIGLKGRRRDPPAPVPALL